MLRYYSLIFILIIFLSGCGAQVRYPGEFPSNTLISHEEIYWFWGIIGENNYEIYDICPKGRVYEIQTNTTITQSIFTALSLGIYSPRTTTIVCSIRGE